MPGSQRADEAGGLCHALRRGNSHTAIFHQDGDCEAFERISKEGRERSEVDLIRMAVPELA